MVKKCASTLMRRMLADINQQHLGLTHLNLAGYFWDARSDAFYQYLQDNAAQMLRDRGLLYGPLRQYVDVSHLRHARVFAMLRDPRDIVVSGYFSARYSHRQPANRQRQARFRNYRAGLGEVSMDDYALGYADRLRPIFSRYQAEIPRDRVLTYESMWYQFDEWIDRFAELLQVDLSAADKARYRQLSGVDEERQEDVRAHRRRGTPGDYQTKLSPAVAARITDQFADTLKWLYG